MAITNWTGEVAGVRVDSHKTRHQDGGADEISLTGLEGSEIRLTPKASSTGAEGNIFNCTDNYVYVAVVCKL
ncbi:MAG: hypothetical protein Q8K85_16725 [Hyphomicrobium sp.]|nr:hypothetical protein [Hyphomicrobium sp.]